MDRDRLMVVRKFSKSGKRVRCLGDILETPECNQSHMFIRNFATHVSFSSSLSNMDNKDKNNTSIVHAHDQGRDDEEHTEDERNDQESDDCFTFLGPLLSKM